MLTLFGISLYFMHELNATNRSASLVFNSVTEISYESVKIQMACNYSCGIRKLL